ncbi:DNA-directed RNA polymerase subunit N [archaeon CG_4_10_14_0_2_um_filter_Archaea_38_6]|nr:MAG: DNA-directed RNA polymerase subunit N [archaeon CG07_land_8_20_14_0_80_38_8]PIU88619.1 MAG: DNA-directed RNA polymerase subunit N [archaeon CG06_land_8_20_14_3_00_37_11]PJA23061.1 MAG: DNA-directed RNA polymerase subunit N [archaeon CG_4_10_14_0_2_um_filter_Archaea_38_6]
MIVPIRCFTCGKPIAHLWEKFQKLKEEKGVKKALDELGLERFCCRAVFLGHVDLIEITGRYKHA